MKRRILIPLAVLTVVVVAAGVRLSSEDGPGSSPRGDVTAEAGAPSPELRTPSCAYPATSAEEWCSTVEIEGTWTRYVLVRADSPSASTMIYDPGGPGVSILSRHLGDLDALAADAHQRGFNLLVIDEPWVVAPHVEVCRTALAGYFASAQAQYPKVAEGSSSGQVRDACLGEASQAAMTADRYRQIVAKIEQVEKVRVERLEGYSFASVRAAYLGTTHPDLVAAVGTPFPVGARAGEFFAAVPSPGAQGDLASGTLAADSAAAYYQMTGLTTADFEPDVASRAFWQTDADGQVSLSRVGYFSEMCRALTGWDEFSASDIADNPSLTAQRSLHAACSGMVPAPDLMLPAVTCFTVLSIDMQTPWQESELTKGAKIEVVEAGRHGELTIPSCG